MYKRNYYKALLFKITNVVVFYTLFFVQLQLKFIENAYNDFSSPSFSATSTFNHTNSNRTNVHKQENNSEKDGYTKLNKRYPLSNLFLIVPAFVVTSISYNLYADNEIYKAPFLKTYSFYVELLRGPPSSI